MPVEFLTEEQERSYGQFTGDLTELELAQFFYLDAADWRLLAARRGDHNRLGFALQLCTVRYLGVFPSDLHTVPERVARFVARQLPCADPAAALERYCAGEMRWAHQAEIGATGGYRDFSDGAATFPLVRLLYTRAWVRPERPSALFDVALTWLLAHKVLLPGITVLARLVARVRDRVAERLWAELGRLLTPEQRAQLDRLLIVPAGDRTSRLDVLRTGPRRVSGPALVQALARLEEVRALGVGRLDLSAIPANRLKVLSTYAITSKAQTLARMPDDRRAATLLAFARTMEASACDDALDVLDLLIDTLLKDAAKAQRQERLRTLRDLDEAALTLADASTTLLARADGTGDDLRAYLEQSRGRLEGAIARVTTLARPPGETFQQELRAKYTTVRHFLPRLLRTIDFASARAGQALVEALDFLKQIEGRKRPDMAEAPLAVIPPGWRRHVAPSGKPVDRAMYTLCVLEQLQVTLRRRDVFVPASTRWADPRAKLLQGAEWAAARATTCQTLRRAAVAEEELAVWERELEAAYRRVAGRLAAKTNTSVRIERAKETPAGAGGGRERDRLVVEPLDEAPEPPALQRLRGWVQRLVPPIDLPELILEIMALTGCDAEFTHISESRARVEDFPITLCAALVAQACNLPIAAVAQRGIPALERDRLLWVQQNYLRPETITRANARLVDFGTQIPLSAVWGGGEVASADGLRFVVPVRTLNAGPNSKYFGAGRGITLLNYTLNNFFGFNGAIVPGTLRDSLYILDGLLNQEPALRPQEIMTDTASYSDMVFGLFALLGYRFSPRLADLGDTRFWRFPPAAPVPAGATGARGATGSARGGAGADVGDEGYGPLEAVARHRINRALIAENWDDILRVGGSLTMGTVLPSELMRMLQGGGRPTTLGRAIGEVGRIAKTFYLLDYVDDEAYRRRILIQLNRGEARHTLARAISFGRRGEIRQPYREGQEEQLGVLGLVLNMVVAWNTLYMDLALAEVRRRGIDVQREDVEREDVEREDVERLSPLGFEHINFLGCYSFVLAERIRRKELLPLRPLAAEEAEERDERDERDEGGVLDPAGA